MKSSEETPKVPPTGEANDPNERVDGEVKPFDNKPVDPKEAARQRSKADLERKRRGGKNSFGKL